MHALPMRGLVTLTHQVRADDALEGYCSSARDRPAHVGRLDEREKG